jgi:hypothetical protein
LAQDIYSPFHKGDIMKTASALLFSLAMGAASVPAVAADGSSFEQRCERDMRPVIEVRAAPLDYQINNTVSSRLLRNHGARLYAGEMMLGMTSLQKMSTVEFDAPSLTDVHSERECVAPRVMVTLVFRPINVYVAREFTPNTCPYKIVLEHEMKHVRIYEQEVPRLTAFVRAQLESRYGQRPLYAKPGQGIVRMQDDVDLWLRPMILGELERVEQLQLALDTIEEKTMMSSSCLGQLADNLGATF